MDKKIMNNETKNDFKNEFGKVMEKGIKEFGNPNEKDKEFMKKHPFYFWCVVFPSILLPFLVFIIVWTILTVGLGTVQYSLMQGVIVVVLYLVGFIGGFFINIGLYGFISPLIAKYIPDYPESIDDFFTRGHRIKLILIGLIICVLCGIMIRLVK